MHRGTSNDYSSPASIKEASTGLTRLHEKKLDEVEYDENIIDHEIGSCENLFTIIWVRLKRKGLVDSL